MSLKEGQRTLPEQLPHDKMNKSSKLAIVGNMNNNGFALMRYFRDLGVDAYLLPYRSDGAGNLSHFRPEDDTWNIDAWRPYIRPIDIENSTVSIVGNIRRLKLPPSRSHIANQFDGYAMFVGSGIAPALFERIGLRLDIFFPYGIGVEFVGNIELLASARLAPVKRLFYSYVRKLQIGGIRNARHCVNADMGMTSQVLDRVGRPFRRLAIPMVYNRENVPNDVSQINTCRQTRAVLHSISQSDLKIFSCSRLLWVKRNGFTDAEWESHSKHSDWLIRGFADFLAQRPDARPVLVLVEYGPDVQATKNLCADLGIESSVRWLPKMPRKQIMLMLQECDIGVGQFYVDPGTLWGGTGWEVLASGRPFMQSFNFTESGFTESFGHPPPPVLAVESPADVAGHFADMHAHPDKRRAIGQASKEWFNKYNGIGLARTWLKLLRAERGG